MIRDEIPYVLVPYKPLAGCAGRYHYFMLDRLSTIEGVSESTCTLHMHSGDKIHVDGSAADVALAIQDARAAALNPMVADQIPVRTAIEAYKHLRDDLHTAAKALFSAMDGQPEGFAGADEFANTLLYWRAAVCIRRLASDGWALQRIFEEIPDVQRVNPQLKGRQFEVAMQFITDALQINQVMQDLWQTLFELRYADLPDAAHDAVCNVMLRNEHLLPESVKGLLKL